MGCGASRSVEVNKKTEGGAPEATKEAVDQANPAVKEDQGTSDKPADANTKKAEEKPAEEASPQAEEKDASKSEEKKDDAGKPRVLFVLGGPGAGKGTQCGKITAQYKCGHLSAGDLLRAEKKDPKSEHGALINEYICEGKIVPVEITIALIKKAMEKLVADGVNDFLIDGFPRNEENMKGWQENMSDFANVESVLFFDCPEEEMEKRLVERGKTSGRADDNIETIKKRFHTYIESTMPVIKYYEKDNKVQKFSAVGAPEDVYKGVDAYLKSIECKEK